MKQRKVLIAIAVVIFILLLLYWLFVAEDINVINQACQPLLPHHRTDTESKRYS